MDALDLLLNRSSQPRLQEPAPQGDVLDNILHAGLRAPDHASLSPWRFIVCTGQGREKLGQIYQQAAVESGMADKDVERAPQLPLRAPMVIVAIAKYQEHEKVPWVEQVASASCAVHSMQMAALAQGFSGIWRTGSYARNEQVKQALDLANEDEIVGFLYLGTPVTRCIEKPAKPLDEFIEYWD